jgi:hypothetical protein
MDVPVCLCVCVCVSPYSMAIKLILKSWKEILGLLKHEKMILCSSSQWLWREVRIEYFVGPSRGDEGHDK